MEKRFLLGVFIIVVIAPYISAACTLDATLVNQDPYPAVPGDYVKIVIQMTGVSGPSCGKVDFELGLDYPFSLDPGAQNVKSIYSGTYAKDYPNYWMIPYNLRVDEHAFENANLTVNYSSGDFITSENLLIEIQDPETEFEVRIISYDQTTNELTLELLNTGENDVEALTIEVPQQENIKIYGSNSETVGSIESTDDERVTFTADVEEGNIDFVILYNDQNNVRRTFQTQAYLDKISLTRTVKTDESNFSFGSFIYGLIAAIIVFFVYRWNKHRKHKKKFLKEQQHKHH